MTYDGAGRVNSLTSALSGLTVLDYEDLSGRIAGVMFPSDASAIRIYDTSGRIGSIEHRDSANQVVSAYAMDYNFAGNATQIVDAAYGTPVRTRYFGYDDLQRLTSQSLQPGSPPTFTYDALGNRLSSVHTYDAHHRVTSDDEASYVYDNVGNLLTKTDNVSGAVTTYRWDSRNQLTQIDFPGGTSAYYRYDALGRRIEKEAGGVVRRYFYDREDIALETDANGAPLRRYRHGPGVDQPLVMEDLTIGASFFYHTDHLGSVKLITDESAQIVAEYDYDAYGQRLIVSEDIVQPYSYTGREYDSESGLYYYRARYYSAQQGRFLSKDPIGFDGGDANLYRYVRNNPIMRTDPFGLLDGLVLDPGAGTLTGMEGGTVEWSVPGFSGSPQPGYKGEGYDPINPGEYDGKNLRRRDDDPNDPKTPERVKDMQCNKKGWSLDVSGPSDPRPNLRIHPSDLGKPKGDKRLAGTEGCIGVPCSSEQQVYDALKDYFGPGGPKTIPITVLPNAPAPK